jgi:sugar transferase (PEP-CTERM/EpsH1 system associated)
MDPEGRNVWGNRLRRLLHPCVDRFVAVSEDLGRWVVGTVGVPPRKVQVIANGVDTERFRDDRRIDARRALGLDDREFVVGSVGRLDPVKDYPTLLEAFAALGGRDPSPLLFLVGDGPQRSALEAQVVNSGLTGRVQLLGERDDVSTVLAALDVFVLPSIAEGMSNVILEAMSSGLPVVATAVGGNPELVLDGSTGRLVPPRSPGLLAAALGSYLAEPSLLRLHGKAGRERVLAHFSLDRMVSAYRDLYRGLLPGSLG